MPRRTALLLILSLLPRPAPADSPQTIYAGDGFKQLRACAQGCFEYNDDGCVRDVIADHVACSYNCFTYALDGCICRPDLQTAAESWLTSCVSSACTDGGQSSVDIASAVSLYDGYCLAAGYTGAADAQGHAGGGHHSGRCGPDGGRDRVRDGDQRGVDGGAGVTVLGEWTLPAALALWAAGVFVLAGG
jgi:hypothetical protein